MTIPVPIAQEAYRTRAILPIAGRTRVEPIAGKGCGVLATETVGAGEIIEENLCFVLSPDDTIRVKQTRLRDYVYFWGDETGADEVAVAVGNLNFCNHSSAPNASIEIDKARGTVAVRARSTIEAGTEITIDYDYPLDFAVQE